MLGENPVRHSVTPISSAIERKRFLKTSKSTGWIFIGSRRSGLQARRTGGPEGPPDTFLTITFPNPSTLNRNPGGTTTVATLQPYGDTTSINDMRDIVCHKKTPEEQSEAPPAKPAGDKPKSPYQEKLLHPTLVAISLGSATGPLPKAMQDAAGNAYADVPIPGWRPDLPPPAGFELAAQDDQAGN